MSIEAGGRNSRPVFEMSIGRLSIRIQNLEAIRAVRWHLTALALIFFLVLAFAVFHLQPLVWASTFLSYLRSLR